MKIIICILLAVLFFSCTGSKSGSESLKGMYDLTLYDSLGTRLIDANLEIKTASNNKLTGTYEVTKKYREDISGMNSSKGNFEGTYESSNSKIFINLNPKMSDNNVFISAEWAGDTIKGSWTYSTFTGVKNKGNALAVRR